VCDSAGEEATVSGDGGDVQCATGSRSEEESSPTSSRCPSLSLVEVKLALTNVCTGCPLSCRAPGRS